MGLKTNVPAVGADLKVVGVDTPMNGSAGGSSRTGWNVKVPSGLTSIFVAGVHEKPPPPPIVDGSETLDTEVVPGGAAIVITDTVVGTEPVGVSTAIVIGVGVNGTTVEVTVVTVFDPAERGFSVAVGTIAIGARVMSPPTLINGLNRSGILDFGSLKPVRSHMRIRPL